MLWLVAIVLWIWFYRSGEILKSAKTLPYSAFIVAVLVYLVQSIGLALVGARYYVGYGWPDQLNYTMIAQFLVDKPFSITPADVGNQAYLANVFLFKNDRIGQSVLHGFFVASSFQDAKTLFEPLILLAPSLLALAIYALCSRIGIGKYHAMLASAAAGMLPSITLLHQLSFLSHALSIPFLLLWPVILDTLIDKPNRYHLTTAAVLMTAATSIYTELWAILVLLSISMIGLAALLSLQRWKLIVYCGVILVSPFVLLPFFSKAIFVIFMRLDAGILQNIYPWAFQAEGIARIWLGEFATTPVQWLHLLGIVMAVLATIGAYCGLALLVLRQIRDRASWQDFYGWRTLIVALAVLGLSLLPLGVFVRGTENPYQFYKLLITISPLFIVGLMVLASDYKRTASGQSAFALLRGTQTVLIGFLVIFAISTASTVNIAIQSTRLEAGDRNLGRLLLAPDIRTLQARLSQLHQDNLLITNVSTPRTAFAVNWLIGWLTYFARDNRIWLTTPMINGTDVRNQPDLAPILDLNSLPNDALILTVKNDDAFFKRPDNPVEKVWSNDTYQLIRTTPQSWFFLRQFTNPNGIETFREQPFFWIGKGVTTLEVFTLRSGTLTIGGRLFIGPSLPENPVRNIRIYTNTGFTKDLSLRRTNESFTVPILAGTTIISIKALDQPSQLMGPNHDRPLLLGMQSPWIQFK